MPYPRQSFPNNMKFKKGFTLIELLIVLGTLSIIATFVVVSFNGSRIKARDAQRVRNIQEIRSALELYYNRNNSYPSYIAPGLTFSNNGTVYMDPVPENPTPRTDGTCFNENYVYSRSSDGGNYTLAFCLGGPTGRFAAGQQFCNNSSCNATFAYDSSATALFARFSGTPSDADKHYMNNLIVSGKTHGWWNKMDIFYVFAIGTNATDSRLNWKSSSYNATAGVAPTWTAYQGITGNGTTQYLTTNYNPTTHGTNYVSGSQSMGFYSRTQSSGSFIEVGGYDGGCHAAFVNSGGDNYNYMASCSANVFRNSSSQGFFIAQRNSTTSTQFFYNGNLIQTDNISSSTVLNTAIFIGARNNGGSPALFSARQIAVAFAGGALTSTEAMYMSLDVNQYMKSIGANVY